MDTKFCQSCGMPLTEELKGTNADGSKNEDYCIYCYKDGAFTQDCSMEEMIDFCAQFVDEVNKNMPKPMTQEEYKQMMRQYFPMLKRWLPGNQSPQTLQVHRGGAQHALLVEAQQEADECGGVEARAGGDVQAAAGVGGAV